MAHPCPSWQDDISVYGCVTIPILSTGTFTDYSRLCRTATAEHAFAMLHS